MFEFLKLIGKNIKTAREQQNISLDQLAKATGISTDYLKKIENGQAPHFTLFQLEDISNTLKTELYDLIR
ncbi:helix-turn-helix transcriptional regulator [bacterium]|nr:helix-turn-helix transcriptional regulator [bacterium]